MENPFPGMNPYLESPYHWQGFHNLLMSVFTLDLNDQLPAPFEARLEQRLYIAPWDSAIYPDSAVFLTSPTSGGVATLTRPTTVAPLIIEQEQEPVREYFVEIILPGPSGDEVITVIELLSPSNKEANSEGYAEYRRKQRYALSSGAHLIEIDLLRGGAHTVAADRALILRHQPFDYLYCLHRAGTGPRFECWAFTLRDALPDLVIPLTDDQPAVIFDLQTVFHSVFRRGKYGRFPYEEDPRPALNREDATWVDALLREKGLRR